jgi:N utilization substance protein A
MKGSRVQAVVQELRGEKIDIVPWDRDPARFVCNAIAPAEVSRVIIDEANNGMELVVPDDKLSLAIGRRGQNVRLASQLTGWKLDIISESKFRQIEEDAISALTRIQGVDENLAKTMYKLGFRSLDEVAEASEQELSGIPGLGGAGNADRIKGAAVDALEAMRLENLAASRPRIGELTDREKLLLVRGVTERIVDLLDQAGYKTIDQIYSEKDVDRLAISTGLDQRRAQAVREGVIEFIEREQQVEA